MKKYIVYSYQYNDMREQKFGAVKVSSVSDFDLLPPTVIEYTILPAKSKKDALMQWAKEK